jgi:signal transduction histidine kinase
MSPVFVVPVYFIYGLAFFIMGTTVALEGGRASDARLRHALRPLAAFGILHGLHEWLEMFYLLELLPMQATAGLMWQALRLGGLSFSFLSLSAFGASALAPDPRSRRLSLLVPLVQVAVWGLGLTVLRGRIPHDADLWNAAFVFTRYSLAIPAALLASAGLIAQQRAFRQAGLTGFSRDSLWASVAFAWYGLVGQLFVQPSLLPPSSVINEALFLRLFGFPVQLLRAITAVAASIFVVRFLRSFEVETQRRIAELQAARVEEAERREALHGQLLGQIVAAQEAERQRIARELHDATGQSLTALGLGLRGVASALPSDSAPAAARLRQLETMAAASLDELRQLIADLRPSHLDDLGLPAALRWYAKQVQERTGLEVCVEIEGRQQALSSPVKIALFRIAQEALNNVIKHSGASTARLQLAFSNGQVRLLIHDDGCGFAPPARRGSAVAGASAGRPAWGLLGMQERAELLGGEFHVESAPARGTSVSVVVPSSAQEVVS